MMGGDQGTGFGGFSLPDGAWIPPELVMLLPELDANGLKCMVVVLYNSMQVGGGSGSSVYDFVNMAGISRPTAIRCAHELVRRGFLQVEQVGRSKLYSPSVKIQSCVKVFDSSSVKKFDSSQDFDSSVGENMGETGGSVKNFYTKLSKLRESDSLNNLTDSSDSTDSSYLTLLSRMRNCGVFLKTAQGILKQYPEEYVEQHLKFFEYALRAGLATGPGWLVLSIRENWQQPLGYVDPEAKDWRRYGEGAFADLVDN